MSEKTGAAVRDIQWILGWRKTLVFICIQKWQREWGCNRIWLFILCTSTCTSETLLRLNPYQMFPPGLVLHLLLHT